MPPTTLKTNLYDRIADRKASVYAECQGKLVKVRVITASSPPMPTEKRSTVKDLSKASRRRLLCKIATVDWEAIGKSTLLTLTYPDQVAERAPATITVDRSRIIRDVETHCGRHVPFLWRVEWKARLTGRRKGELTQHIHLLALGLKYFPHAILLKRWQQIVGYDKFISVNCRRTKNVKQTAMYAAKYVAKTSLGCLDNDAYLNRDTGRVWGITRPSLVPWCSTLRLSGMSEEEVERAMRIAGDVLGKHYLGSFYLLGDDARKIFRKIAGYGNPRIEQIRNA